MSFIRDFALAFVTLLLVCIGAYFLVVVLLWLSTVLLPNVIFFGTLTLLSLGYAWEVRD